MVGAGGEPVIVVERGHSSIPDLKSPSHNSIIKGINLTGFDK